jgi:hypothetical protein
MSEDLRRAMERQSRELAGPSPIEQHIILFKLTELIKNMPEHASDADAGASPQRQWIAEVGALISRVSSEKRIIFNTAKAFLSHNWVKAVRQIQGQVLDVIEELKLDLELSGRADIGSAYSPGDAYKYFADLKSIIGSAQSDIFLIDPYFDGEAFNNYLACVVSGIEVRIFANKHAQEVKAYIDKHKIQFNSNIEVRKNKNLHDRLVIIDRSDCWITGGSLNHGGMKSPSYLIPVGTELANGKLSMYDIIWNDSKSTV